MKLGALVALLLVVGVGQAGAAPAPPSPLARLVLQRSDLGRAAAGLQIELISGEISNARAADDSFDPADTATSLAKAGRLTGFRLIYGDPGFEALRRGRGLIDLGTSLDYFKTPKQASAYEAKSIRDVRRSRGQNLGGVVVGRVSTFRVRGLGTAAIGVRVVQRIGDKPIYNTYVDFQLGRLICEAAVRRADSSKAETEAVAIAQLLADRILRYSQGTLVAKAVTLPRPLGTSRPRPGAPDLEKMVLKASDLEPAVVAQQGYAPDDNAMASYFRRFSLQPRSGLFLLRNAVALERSEREAAGRMLILRSTFTGPEAAETLAALVTPGAKGPKLDGPARSLGIGKESFAVSATFTVQSRRLRVVLVHARRDRVVESLIAVGTAKALTNARIDGYGRALNRTLKRAFAKPKLTA
jgi:hypothetical protein